MSLKARKLQVLITDNTDPAENLAVEKYLTMNAEEGSCVLFLWQNAGTIVIGRNQNIYSEVDVKAAESDGIRIVRRMSGGGAVFHDLGNLNFTFISRSLYHDVDKQIEVVLNAVRLLGIDAQRTGRNDLTAEGGKFSGHAFFKSGSYRYHHGTLIVNVDTENMKYLTPSKEKLRSKGVKSVKSRVVNLQDLSPEITIDSMKDAMIKAFESTYGLESERLELEEIYSSAAEEIYRYRDEFSSRSWIYGREISFDLARKGKFDWGEAQICLKISDEGDSVDDCIIYSDAMDQDFICAAENALKGAEFDDCAMSESILSLRADGELTRVRENLALLFS